MTTHPRTMAWHAAELIAAMIADGTYKPGDRIDPDGLRADHDITRTTFREAVRLLEGKGMITARPMTGTRITEPHQWNVTDPDVTRWLTPSNAGSQYQAAAHEFHALLAAHPDMAANPFYRHAYDAVVAIQKEYS